MNLTQVPISMIDTVAGDAGKVLTSDGSTLSWSSDRIAKAWVNFNGTTSPGTIRSSYNVSSVTKNATGDYTINFTTPMADANYAMSGAAQYTAGGFAGRGSFVGPYSTSTNPYSATAIRVQVTGVDSLNGAYADSSYINVTIFGN